MGLVIAVAILAVLTAAGVTVYIKVRRLSESLLGTPDVTEGHQSYQGECLYDSQVGFRHDAPYGATDKKGFSRVCLGTV